MNPPPNRFIVITGVSGGLGHSLAAELTRLGHRVAGCGRTQIPAHDPRRRDLLNYESVDVANDDLVAAWSARLIRDHGAPDLLVNNAAIINRNAPLWEISAEEFQQLVNINIVGVANVIRHFVPAMIERGTGVVVNLSSGWGRSTSPQVAPYCASKWAIEGLTKSLAQEVPKNMAAVALNPGIIDTPMLRSSFGNEAGGYIKPDVWSRAAAAYLLELGAGHNGKSLTVPGQ